MRDEDSARDACHLGMAASKLLSGDSLPPRKRLLVGLKQNGWSISCLPSPCTPRFCGSSSHSAVGAGGTATTKIDRADGSAAASGCVEVQKQVEEGCARCGGCENNAWQRLKKGGVYQRFCNSCVLLYSTNLYCPHCLGLYEDASNLEDASVWIMCSQCRRSVHVACESENNSIKASDPLPYLCPNCSVPKSQLDAIFSSKESLSTETRCNPVNCMKSKQEGTVDTAAENPHLRYHVNKKSRHETVGLGLGHKSIMPTSSGAPPACESSLGTVPISLKESAAAAKATAYMAAKAAAAARAKATAKACAAAKAAVMARTALEAATFAARAEARVREELSRRSGPFGTEGQASGRIQITVGTEWEAGENVDKAVDDEELARKLHRVFNSSPRITRSATPVNKKIEINTGETEVKGFAHGNSCSPDEPPPFPKPQLTRPRSSIHKENKRWEPRFSSLECAKVEAEKTDNALASSTSETAITKNEIARGHQSHSSQSACIDNPDSGMTGPHKLDEVVSVNRSNYDKNGCNLKPHSFCSTLSPIICEDRTKVGYKIKKIADVTACEAGNLLAEESKAKQVRNPSAEEAQTKQAGYLPAEEAKAKEVGVSERRADACMKAEDADGALRVIIGAEVNAGSCAGHNTVGHNEDLTDQPRVKDDGFKGQEASVKIWENAVDKHKVHNWKSVSKFSGSVDNKKVRSDTRTSSLKQKSEDNDNKLCTSRQNGVKNSQLFRLNSYIKPFVDQHSQSEGTVNRQEPNQSQPKRKVSVVEKVASTVGSLSKVTNWEDDLALRDIELLKSKELLASAMPLTAASSSASPAFVSLSDPP